MIHLDEVRDRCRILLAEDSDDGRAHWLFAGIRIHAPDFSRDPTGQTLLPQRSRRAVWHLLHGRPIPAGWRVWSKCQVPNCIHPDCLACGNYKRYGQSVARSGHHRGVIHRALASRRNGNLQRKVTPAIAADIQSSNDSGRALAARHQLHPSTISRVRRGQLRLPGNPFQGLLP